METEPKETLSPTQESTFLSFYEEVSDTGKLLVLSVSDCEEHIFNRIMAAIIDEPELDHITLPLSAASLSFPDLEIRLKDQTVSCRGQLVTLTHHEFAVLVYLARHPGWVFSASQIYEAV